MSKRIEYKENDVINGFVFIKDTEYRDKRRFAIFKCPKCNNEFETRIDRIFKIETCGCYRWNKKHGLSGTRLHIIWRNMMDRCYKSNHIEYKRYGNRNISVCKAWCSFECFHDWAINNGYTDQNTLDRINNNLGYFPDNCRWTDKHTQSANRRKFNNKSSKYIGVSYHVRKRKWQARIQSRGRTIFYGTYESEIQAAFERDKFLVNNNLLEYTLNF